MADNELKSAIVPEILAGHEDYFLTYADFQPGSTQYKIPARAIGQKLQDVVLVVSGKERDLPRIDSSRLRRTSEGFYIRGTSVIFPTAPTNTVRLYFYIRPNRLVGLDEAALISSVGVNQVTVASIPTLFDTTKPLDFIDNTGTYEAVSFDQTPTSTNGNDISFAELSSSVQAGMYLCQSGETPIIPLPDEIYPVLVQRTAIKVLEAVGDNQAIDRAQLKLEEIHRIAFKSIEPRVDKAPQKIIGGGRLSRGYYLYGGGYGRY